MITLLTVIIKLRSFMSRRSFVILLLLLAVNQMVLLAFNNPRYQSPNRFLKIRWSPDVLVLAAQPAGVAETDVNALPESKRRVGALSKKVTSNLAPDVLNIRMLRETVKDMEQESSQAGFWDDQDKAQALLSEMNRLKLLIASGDKWKTSCEDVETLLEMAMEDQKDSECYVDEAVTVLNELEKDMDAFEVERLLSGKYDKYGCTICIQSGAGGTEAQDWAGMLYEFYYHYSRLFPIYFTSSTDSLFH